MQSDTRRLFLASSLPFFVHNWLDETYLRLKKIDCDVKWVKSENCHLTLKFLGDTSVEKISEIKAALKNITSSMNPIDTHLTDVGAFPRIERPQIVWLGLEDKDKQLEELAKAVENDFEKIGFQKEVRDFKAHITIARVKTGRNIKTFIQALNTIKDIPPEAFRINEVALYQSTLTPQGPLYEVIESFPLKRLG